MSKQAKKQKELRAKIIPGRQYAIEEAIQFVKQGATAKFDESVDIAVVLGVDASKSEQGVRGAAVLPNGTGKKVRVAVFAQADTADKAKKAGADIVGLEALIEKIKANDFEADVVIATPDTMRIVSQVGQILGPKGLMPNPKVGKVTNDVALAVKNAKGGQVRYRADKAGVVHCSVGKASFEATALKQNIEFLLTDLKRMKPANAKGIYLKKLVISSTMGPGVTVDLGSL